MTVWYIAVGTISTIVVLVIGMPTVLDSTQESFISSMFSSIPFVTSNNSFIFTWRVVVFTAWISPHHSFKDANKVECCDAQVYLDAVLYLLEIGLPNFSLIETSWFCSPLKSRFRTWGYSPYSPPCVEFRCTGT